MLYEKWLAKAFCSMTATYVKSPAAIHCMIPGNWMIFAILSAFIAVFIQLCQNMNIRFYIFIIVPFISAFPLLRQALHSSICRVSNDNSCLPYIRLLWMTFKVSTYQFVIP